MAKKTWIIALCVGCGVVLLAIVVVVLGARWLVTEMERAGAEPLTATELRDCELVRDGASVTARGSVLNGGKGAIRDVKVRLQWTDGSGTMVVEDWVHTSGDGGLAPGESGGFEYVLEDPAGAIAGVACLIECVENDQALHCYGP